MPFVSQAQRAWMYSNKPEMAKKWEEHTPKGIKLPKHVKKHKMKSTKEHFNLVTGRHKINNKKQNTMAKSTHSIHAHTSAHDEMTVGEMHKHHMSKMHPAHPAHPMNKHLVAGTTGVRHVDGAGKVEHKTMAVHSDHGK